MLDPSSSVYVLYFCRDIFDGLPVVKHNVRQPNFIAGNPDPGDAAEIFGVPYQQLIVPLLIQPHVGRHHLVLLVLIKYTQKIISKLLI